MAEEQVDVGQIIRSQLAERGWDVLYKLNVERKETQNIFDASMNQRTWHIDVTVDPEFEEKLGKIARDSGLNISAPVQKALRGIVDHEMGHWELCPSDIVYLESMLNSVSKGLSSGGLSEQEVKQYSPYAANMFSDAVINCSHMRDQDFSEAYGLLQASRVYTSPNSQKNGQPLISDYFGLFTDLQMKLVRGDKSLRELAERYVADYPALAKTSEQLLGILVGKELAKKAFSDSLTEEDMDDVAYILKDRSSWDKKSKRFARVIAPYIKDQIEDMKKNQPLMPMLSGVGEPGNKSKGSGNNDSEGSETKGSENAKRIIKQGLDRLESEAEGEKKSEEKEEGKEAAKGGKKESDEELGRKIGEKVSGSQGGTEMGYAARHEVYDELYKRRAGQIVVNFLDNGEGAPSVTLFHMAKRRMNGEEKLDNTVAWEKTIFVNEEPWLFKKDMPFDITSPGPSSKGSYEDILFMMDVSGSMGWSDTPLDGSRYDMAIRTVYSVINYLEKSGKAPFLNYGLLQFSYDTTWSGWKSYHQTKSLTEGLFTGFQGGGTVLEPRKVEAADSRPGKHFLTIMVTDGEITNPDEAFRACSKVALDHKNDFVLFQIESESTFGRKMQEIGVPVIQIDKPEDLIGITLDIVRSKYASRFGSSSKVSSTQAAHLLGQARRDADTPTKLPNKKLHT